MNTRTKKVAYLGLMAALAMILSYVESLFPPLFTAVPGIKMGLPNIVIIFALYRFGLKEAATVSFIRLITIAMLFGTPLTFAYSLAGAVLSLALMALFKKLDLFSTVGVSIIGGVMHNLGQILVAILVMETAEIGYYMIVLAVTGTLSGAFIGLCGAMLIKYMKNIRI